MARTESSMLKKLFGKKGSTEAEVAAVPSAEEQTAVPEVTPEEASVEGEEPKLKKGFLRGAWEATKKLALTPV